MANNLSQRSGTQVLREAYQTEDRVLRVVDFTSLVPKLYDEIALTYITSGNGVGEIGTVTYKNQSVVVATLTLTYDSSNRLISTVRS